MNLSARNQLRGKIKDIKKGDLMAEITVDIGGQELVSVITASSVDRLGLKAGDEIAAVIKATEVMILK
jgi:molybdopterin-binding protein